MAVKLSNFLSTSLAQGLDSATVTGIISDTIIPLDSNTSGNYVKELTAGSGIVVTGSGSHSAVPTIAVDSAVTATLTSTQTLTNKTINLTNNTLQTTLGQLNAAVSGATLVSLNGAETLTNKILTSPTINGPTINGPGSVTGISTFSVRDATTTSFDLQLKSNSVSPVLSADRVLTFDVNNADRLISLAGNIDITGNLTLAGSLQTVGANSVSLTTTGTTSITLPTSGTLVSKDGNNDVTIAGTMTAASFVGDGSTLSGLYLTADFDSDFATKTTSDLTEGSNLYHTTARVRSSISAIDAGGDGSFGYDSATGQLTYTGPSATEVRAHFSAGEGIDLASGVISGEDATTTNKGIASFNTNDFIVSSGAVSIKSGGVSNTQLAGSISNDKLVNSTITILGNSVALGGSLNFNTDSVAEGVSNLYYTQIRVDSDIDARVTKTYVDALNVNADTLDGQHGSYYRIDVYDANGTLLN